MSRSSPPPPDQCPNCGAEVPPGARACPECGSCPETGWSEQAPYDEVDLPDQEFDYDDFVRREFAGKKLRPRGIGWFWWIVAGLVLVAFIALILR